MLPFRAAGIRLYGFVFPANRERLVALCKRYLGFAREVDVSYHPFPPLVVATFARVAKLTSEDPQFEHVGWSSEIECALWVFTPAVRRSLIPLRLTWFVPYIFVDLPMAMAQGREIFGFPKEIARFPAPAEADWHAQPADGPNADRFAVEAFGVERFDRSEFKYRPLLTIERARTRAPTGTPDGHWDNYEDAARAFHERIDTRSRGFNDVFTALISRFVHTWPPAGTAVLLKQIWGTEQTNVPCHQAIVEAAIEVKEFRGGWWLRGPYQLAIKRLASHPIEEDLGLDTLQESLFAYWLDFDFTLTPGRRVWTAPPP